MTNSMVTTADQKCENESVPAPPAARPWSKGRKWLVSLLLIWHLGAMISAPCAYPPPSSQLARNIAGFFSPYQHFAFLNHGYRFFAPNPGPSHIVRYEVDTADGETVKGQFPDPDAHWPRLLYHRHFMISETVYREGGPISEGAPLPELGAELTAEEQEAFDIATSEYESRLALVTEFHKGIARELLDRCDGERVRLTLVEHLIASPVDVQEKRVQLDDPQLYVELAKLAEYSKDEL